MTCTHTYCRYIAPFLLPIYKIKHRPTHAIHCTASNKSENNRLLIIPEQTNQWKHLANNNATKGGRMRLTETACIVYIFSNIILRNIAHIRASLHHVCICFTNVAIYGITQCNLLVTCCVPTQSVYTSYICMYIAHIFVLMYSISAAIYDDRRRGINTLFDWINLRCLLMCVCVGCLSISVRLCSKSFYIEVSYYMIMKEMSVSLKVFARLDVI